MKTIEFVKYTNLEGKAEEIITNIQELDIDPQAIAEIDYFSQESRRLSVTLPTTSWLQEKIENIETIQGTDFWEYAIRVKENGETTYIGWIKKQDIEHDHKTQEVRISANDHLSLLCNGWDKEITLQSGAYYLRQKLPIWVGEVLPISIDVSAQLSHLRYTGDISIPVTNEEYFSGDGGGESYPDENTLEYHWRNISIDGSVIKGVFLDYQRKKTGQSYAWSYYHEEISRLTFSFSRIHGWMDDIIGDYLHQENDFVYGGEPAPCYLYEEYYSADSYPRYDNLMIHDEDTYLGYMLSDSRLSIFGIFGFGTLELLPDEGSSQRIIAYRDLIRASLLPFDAAILSVPSGIVLRSKKFIGDTEPIIIDDAELLEYKKSFVNFSFPDIEGKLSIFRGAKKIEPIIQELLLKNVKNIMEYEIKTTKAGLEFGDRIIARGKEMKIISIKTDNDNFITEIKAWGI